MAVNQKAVKVLNKVLEAGFTDEKAIARQLRYLHISWRQ